MFKRKPAKPIGFVMMLLTLTLAPRLSSAQQESAAPNISVVKLSNSVHLLTAARKGNTNTSNVAFSSGPDGILLVDGLTESLAEHLRPAIKAASGKAASGGQVKWLINTHWHNDHTGGNLLFGREATIIAHPSVGRRLMTEQRPPWEKNPIGPSPPVAWPALTFEQTMSLHFNGEEIRLIHFPNSHTDGDTVVHFTGSKVVCLGDTVYVIDGALMLSPIAWNGGDAESLAKNLETLIPQFAPDVKVIPGHGPLLTLDDLKIYHRTLTRVIDLVRRQMTAGKKFAEIIAQGLPTEVTSGSNWKIDQEEWLGIVCQSLARKK